LCCTLGLKVNICLLQCGSGAVQVESKHLFVAMWDESECSIEMRVKYCVTLWGESKQSNPNAMQCATESVCHNVGLRVHTFCDAQGQTLAC